MKLQIHKIILWPKNGGKYRDLDFAPGKVNIISGSSKAGKSAVIPIIDYCLGSERCAIPVGTIRKTCAWFGILVDTDEGQKLLARAEPGNQRSTDDMFIVEGQYIEIPETIDSKNTNRENIKEILNRLSGLPNLGFGDDSFEFGFKNRPSFRDLMAFTFQPQNIVANPDVLFYKADSYGNREKLKSIFPFILGAVDSKSLVIAWEIKELRKQLKTLQGELSTIEAVSKRWQAEANVWFYRAREYGLVDANVQPQKEWPRLLEQLQGIAQKTSRDAVATPAAAESSTKVLSTLREREKLMGENIFVGKQKLDDLREIKAEAQTYTSSLKKIGERLSLSSWLRELATNNPNTNPLAFPTLSPSAQLEELCDALAKIEQVASSTPRVSASVESEIVRLRNLIRQDTETLAGIQSEIKGIEARDELTARHALQMTEIDRFLGSMQHSIETYSEARSDSSLAERVKALEERIKILEPQVSDESVKLKTSQILAQISYICALITPHLDAEWADAKITLSIADLAIKVKHDGRDDFLWEVGSGANWLAYHIAMLLALQLYFLKKPDHAVPHLLIFDQPSQVYFPVKSATKKTASDQDGEDKELVLDDEDRDAVRKVFSVLARGVNRTKGRLQIIVLDHAGSEVWDGIDGVILAEEWRDGEKLVPPRFEG
ncbi:hypothetical protein PS900_03411 [Pseudomonas fluorescens]|uniref:DUF3732 domain-containing protein n=1 Tax=Pseudomonas fluorescens TaxID=294 RepID=A0A8H2NT57_PSEFL|nr:DUF3732 domain-containing protein [Pseudomonas fluorescens]VVP12393.1 hypothetical protein PS900_03411 [Pseudomonas fluorescens]